MGSELKSVATSSVKTNSTEANNGSERVLPAPPSVQSRDVHTGTMMLYQKKPGGTTSPGVILRQLRKRISKSSDAAHLCRAKVHVTSQERSGRSEISVCEMLEMTPVLYWPILETLPLQPESINSPVTHFCLQFWVRKTNSAVMSLKGTLVWLCSLAGNLMFLYVPSYMLCYMWSQI